MNPRQHRAPRRVGRSRSLGCGETADVHQRYTDALRLGQRPQRPLDQRELYPSDGGVFDVDDSDRIEAVGPTDLGPAESSSGAVSSDADQAAARVSCTRSSASSGLRTSLRAKLRTRSTAGITVATKDSFDAVTIGTGSGGRCDSGSDPLLRRLPQGQQRFGAPGPAREEGQ